MQDKIRLINLLTLINEYSIEKNDKSSFTEYNYTTLSGGNIIELTISPEAYNIINQLWSQGDY